MVRHSIPSRQDILILPDVTSTLTTLIIDGISSHAMLLDSFVVLHAAFISSMHKLIGVEFGRLMCLANACYTDRTPTCCQLPSLCKAPLPPMNAIWLMQMASMGPIRARTGVKSALISSCYSRSYTTSKSSHAFLCMTSSESCSTRIFLRSEWNSYSRS